MQLKSISNVGKANRVFSLKVPAQFTEDLVHYRESYR
jgi:hypothetical protein